MSFGAITGSGNTPDIRGAAASARPGGVAASLAVQVRFDALDAVQLATRQASQQTRPDDGQAAFDPSGRNGGRNGGEQAGSRPPQSSTAFLAQALAQEQDNTAGTIASAALSGTAAYARTASRSAPPAQDTTSEVLLPLNSGRTLDLAV